MPSKNILRLAEAAWLVAAIILGVTGCGVGLAGRIYSLDDASVLPMEIETSYGYGKIRCDNPKTGEHFEGTYSAVGSGATAVTTTGSAIFLQSINANAIATLVGDQGGLLDCRMDIQRGIRPHGMGACVDRSGKQYRLQF